MWVASWWYRYIGPFCTYCYPSGDICFGVLVIGRQCDCIDSMDRVSQPFILHTFTSNGSKLTRLNPLDSPLFSPQSYTSLLYTKKELTNSDGTITSLVPTAIIGLLLFAPTLYISLDTSQNWTNTFTLGDNVEAKTLFVLTLIWPAAYVPLFTSYLHLSSLLALYLTTIWN